MSANEDNENNKILMSSKDGDDEGNESKQKYNKTNDSLDGIIYISKSFKDQIKLIRKVENLNEYYFINNHGDKIF